MSTSDSNSVDNVTGGDGDLVFDEEQLRQAAQALDEGRDAVEIGEPKHGGSDPSSEVGDDRETNNNNASRAAERSEGEDQSERAEKSAGEDDVSKQRGNEKTEQADSSGEKPLSRYERAKKDAERYDRNWKKLQERQAELARAQAELAEREKRLAAGAPSSAKAEGAPDTRSVEDYEAAAADWERAGKFDLAELARKQAARLREAAAHASVRGGDAASAGERVPQAAASQAEAQQGGPASPAFVAEWNAHLRELEATREFADLGDRESELYRATAQVLRSDARFSRFPDGIRIAAQIARLQVDAGAVPKLREQLQAQQEELAKLRAATSPSRGAPNSRGQSRPFEALSLAEQEAELARMAAEYDAA